MPLKAKIYFWSTVILGAFGIYWYFPDFDFIVENVPIILVLGVFSFLTEIFEVEVLPEHEISVSTAIYLSAIFLGGMSLAIVITLPAIFASELVNRGSNLRDRLSLTFAAQKLVFNTAQIAVSVVVAALVFRFTGGQPPPFLKITDYIPAFFAFSAYTFLNIALVDGIVSLTQGKSFLFQLRLSLRRIHIEVLSLGVLSILLAVTYQSSPWNLLLIAVLLLLVNTSLKNYLNLKKQAKQTFEKIMDLLNKRDPYTHKHSESVGDLTEAIADQMRISPDRKEDIVSAARVHDIGKLGIPDSILLKKGSLNEEEWETMKEHPELGADILSGLTIYENSVDIVRYEHERWDGSGYPDGLEGENIPLGSRVVAGADVWNALRTKRPYRGPLSKEEAKKEVKEMSGVKLDPEIVDILLTVVDSESVEVET